ncbi:MATE family efflux transporter [Rhodobacter sp. KR11]|uniref:MATE family efflux transporter n=1 Tax=Rhodobacter sp. KR11 TaxID=2974588 RepID=UPI0022217E66|nr:MATE family efflux transporter [Rhodobacter sp. KR11]MCW1919895.1 MATE family efflux transporter [Rhodobacter sp. KR11]
MSVRRAVPQDNPFLTAPIGRLFLSNTLPMALVMSMGGLLNVVDGVFVGRFIGAEALAAVSLAFPVVMLISALTTLAGGGMSSLLARSLGAGDRVAAARVFAGAHGLVVGIAALLVGLWALFGQALLMRMAAGNVPLAQTTGAYLSILIWAVPVQLLLGLHADALRVEGRAGAMAALSVLVNLFNIGANWLGIVILGLGIAGSALGTVAAQVLGLALALALRARGPGLLPLGTLRQESWFAQWRPIVTLGLPLCLSFLGIALVASMAMLALRQHAAAYDTSIAAYGAVTRLLSLAFLPQLAIALALQAIAGQNVGAGQGVRAVAALRLSMTAALLWCGAVALTGLFAGQVVSRWFTSDPHVTLAIVAILRPMLALYVFAGPILVLAMYLQALGQPGWTAALTLVKPWVLMPLLILGLSARFGVAGIWLAFPMADAVVLLIAVTIGRAILRGATAPGTEEAA